MPSGAAARGFLLGAQATKLVAHRVRPAPHLCDLDPTLAQLAHRELALDPRVVEQAQRAVDRLRGGRVPEAMRDDQPPVPVVLGVGTRVARREIDRRVDVARLVRDPQIELEIGPVVGERVDDLLKCVREGHRPQG